NHMSDTRSLLNSLSQHADTLVPILNEYLSALGQQAATDPRQIIPLLPLVGRIAAASRQAQVTSATAQRELEHFDAITGGLFANEGSTGANTGGSTNLPFNPGDLFPTTNRSANSTNPFPSSIDLNR